MGRKLKTWNIGLRIFEIGFIGFLIGAAALDGPDFEIALIIILISMMVAWSGLHMIRRNEERRELEEARQKARDATFQAWLLSERMVSSPKKRW